MKPKLSFCLAVFTVMLVNLAIVLAQCAGDPGPCVYKLPGPQWEDYNRCAWESFRCFLPQSCLSSSGNFTLDSEGIGCLCGNKGFITALAIHLYRYCHCEVLNRTVSIFVQKCAEISKQSAYNESKIIAIGSGQAQGCIDPVGPCKADGTISTSSTTTLRTTDTTRTTASTEDPPGGEKTGYIGNGGLSNEEKNVAIGVPVGLGVPLLITVVVAAVWLWNRTCRHNSEPDPDTTELTDQGSGELYAPPTGQTTEGSESNPGPNDAPTEDEFVRLGGRVFTEQESLYDLRSNRNSELRSSTAH